MIGIELGYILAILGALNALGWLYNRFVTHLENCGYDEGYTAILVVGGVLGTLLGASAIRLLIFHNGVSISSGGAAPFSASAICAILFLLDLAAFAASGFWMIWGSWRRYAERRHNGQKCHQHHHD